MDIVKYHRKIQDIAIKDAYKSTCQLLKFENGNPKSYASGVFIRIDNSHFMFTASHVIDDEEKKIYIGEKNTFKQIGGEWIQNSLPIGRKREDDRIDVAILKLDDASIEFIKSKHEFLTTNDIQINHRLIEAPLYTAIGFPCSQNKFNKYKNELKRMPFILITEPALDEAFNQLNCDPTINIIVNYNKDKIFNHKTGKKLNGPTSYGISGAGLWYLPCQSVNSGEKISNYLVGILHTWPKQNRKYWVATQIDVFTEIIRIKYELEIEMSKQITVEM